MGATYYVTTSGNDSTGDGSAGNPYASPGKALAVAVAAASAGYTIKVVTGTYNVTTASTNVAAGCLNFNLTGSQTAFNKMLGVTSTVDDTPANFTLALGAGLAATVLTTNNANSFNEVRNFIITGNSTSAAAAIVHNGRSNRLINWKASGFAGGGAHIVNMGSNALISRFEISGGATANFAALNLSTGSSLIERGWIHGNAGRGVDTGSAAGCTIRQVASTDHTGSNGYGFLHQTAAEILFDGIVADNNAQAGLIISGSNATADIKGGAFTRNGAYGIDNTSKGPDSVRTTGCVYYGNTGANNSGKYATAPNVIDNEVATPASLPYAASGNYALNAAGAAAKGVTYSFPGGGCTSFEDSSVVQSAASGGGGIILVGVR